MAVENEGKISSASNQQIISHHNNNTNDTNMNAIATTPTLASSSVTTTTTALTAALQLQQQKHQQLQQQQQQNSLINGNCSGNSNNNSINSNNSNHSIRNNGHNGNGIIGISSIIGSATVVSQNAITTPPTTNKSETSSNASINGSIKKGLTLSTSAAAATAVSNSNLRTSREDVASIGGNSSTNSQSTTNNNSNHLKGSKNNLNSHFYNALPPPATARHYQHNNNNNIGLSEGDGLGPLPSKWEKAYTENGELYFIDHNSGTSHWLDPRLSKFQKKSLEDCLDDELPYGWEKIDDPQYGTYFIDHVNRRTQYENPVLEAKRRIDRNRNEQMKKLTGSDQQQQQQQQQNKDDGQLQQSLQKSTILPYTFTRNPAEMRGERITTTLLKSSRGLGITIVGGDDNVEEFLQIKSIVPNGPAWLDGKLAMGDILVYVNDTCVLGFTHHEMVNVFQSILPGETVTLEVCRGYPLPFDPNDPNTEVVTTIAVDGISSDQEKSRILMDLNMDGNYNFLDISDTAGAVGGPPPPLPQIQKNNNNPKIQNDNIIMTNGINNESYIGDDRIILKKPEILHIDIVKGIMGFGFTIADSAYGQKVKKILDRNCCKNLQESDILLEINNIDVKHKSHSEVVQVLKDCPKTKETHVKVQRGHYFDRLANGSGGKMRKGIKDNSTIAGMFRSKTPTADLYSTQQKEILPIRPKTPLVDTRRARAKTPSNELNDEVEAVTSGGLLEKSKKDDRKSLNDTKSNNSLHEIDSINNDIPFMDPYPKLVTTLTERLAEASIMNDNHNNLYQHPMEIHHNTVTPRLGNLNNGENGGGYDINSINQEYTTYGGSYGVNSTLTNGNSRNGRTISESNNDGLYSPPPPMPIIGQISNYHQESCYCFECQDYNRYQLDYQNQQLLHHQQHMPSAIGYGHNSLPHNTNNNRLQYNHQKRVNEYMIDRRKLAGFRPLENHHHQPILTTTQYGQTPLWKYDLTGPNNLIQSVSDDEYTLSEVTLHRHALGFGFRIVGGTEEGSQVTVGHIVPGGAADGDPRITSGDEILSIDGVNVVNSSHHKVVSLMGEAAHRGQVTMILRRRIVVQHRLNPSALPVRTIQYPYDVIVSRHENEGFGFVIISSSNQFYGSTIGKLIPGSPADLCGDLKVGDRIIAVNRIEIAGMSHGEVVNLIKESGLHVRLTIGCPQENGSNVNNNNNNNPNGGIIGISGNPIQLQQNSEQSPIIAALKADHQQHQQLQQQQQQQQQQHQNSIGGQYYDHHRSHLTQHPQL